MSTTIYYFSGTGNSLSYAEKLAARLDGTLVGMASMTKAPQIDCTGQVVGVIFPVYMYHPPRLVAAFLERLRSPEYLFAVAIHGGDPGDALATAKRHLNKNGVRLDAGFDVRFPDNYIPFGGPPSEDEQTDIFHAAEEKLAASEKIIQARENHSGAPCSWFKTRIHPGLWYALGYWAIPQSDKGYWVNDKCTECGVCKTVCPVGNIALVDKKPKWRNNCQQCMACLQWCKEEAIELGKKSVGVKRYRHPEIKRKQIAQQKKPKVKFE